MPLFFYTLYIEGQNGGNVGEGEVVVRVNILDENDNQPEFEEGFIHASVPTTAEYGHPVTMIKVYIYVFKCLFIT